jgi:protein-disulfide isomerase
MTPVRTYMSVAASVVLIAVVVWIVVTNLRNPVSAEANGERETISADVQNGLIAKHTAVLGSSTARFKIIEFSDFQCPYCRAAEPILVKFISHHPEDAVVFRYDFPLQQIHRYAYTAALASQCAEMQDVGEPFQSLLFEHQKEFSTLDWLSLAKQSGVEDAAAFQQCLNDEKPRDHVLRDIKAAESLGIEGTPSFIIDQTLYTNGVTDEMLESLFKDKDSKLHSIMHKIFNM